MQSWKSVFGQTFFTTKTWHLLFLFKDAMHNNIVCYSNINSTDIYVDIYNVEDLQLPCINSYLTPFYFIMFTLTGQFILMNLVIAVLMNQLEVIWIFKLAIIIQK